MLSVLRKKKRIHIRDVVQCLELRLCSTTAGVMIAVGQQQTVRPGLVCCFLPHP